MKPCAHHQRALALVASLLALAVVATALQRQRRTVPPRRPTIRVGFVGNSFTYYNDLPGLLARATGLACDACTRGGASLASLLRDGGDSTGHAAVRFAKAAAARGRGADAAAKAEAADVARVAADVASDAPAAAQDLEAFLLATQRDVVVVQDFSRGPIQQRDEGVSTLQRLAPLLHEARVVVLYSTWAYDNAVTRADDELSDTAAMARGLATGYEAYARALRAAGVKTIAIAPVGAAFELVRAADEARWRSLFARDGYHPSPTGTYLAGRVLQETIANVLRDKSGGFVDRELGVMVADGCPRVEITWDEKGPGDLADAARRACEAHPCWAWGHPVVYSSMGGL